MTGPASAAVLVVGLAWILAVGGKAVWALAKGQRYRFGLWDGGMLRQGMKLSREGVKIKIAACLLMAAAMLGLLWGWLPYAWGLGTLTAAAITSIGSDLVFGSPDEEAGEPGPSTRRR